MWVDEPQRDDRRTKDVKVSMPAGYHVKLQSIKVLTGKGISAAVTEALDEYFGTREA